jgi:hypothetical protein
MELIKVFIKLEEDKAKNHRLLEKQHKKLRETNKVLR